MSKALSIPCDVHAVLLSVGNILARRYVGNRKPWIDMSSLSYSAY